jgi:hypothetical protein
MYRSVRFISLVLILVAVVSTMVLGQELVQIRVPFLISSSALARVDTLWCGVHGDGVNPPGTVVDNTYGPDIDLATFGTWKETANPPDGMSWDVITKWIQIPTRTALPPDGIYATGLKPNDFRGYTSATQIDTFQINVYGDGNTSLVSTGSVTIAWPAGLLQYATQWELKIKSGASYTTLVSNLGNAAGSYTDPNAGGSNNIKYLLIKYGAFQPPPGPFCDPAPASLNLGNVSTNVTTNTIAIGNHGATNALTVTGITAPTGFTATMAITTVAAGGSQPLVVTFNATALAAGVYAGNIVLTHNAVTGTTTSIPVTATVVDPAIVVNPATTIEFGTVAHPATRTASVTLTNASPLRAVTGIAFGAATGYSVAPAITSLAAGASATLTVTFTTQGTGGTQGGPIPITSTNAPAASILVHGVSQIQGGTLQFANALDTLLDNSYNGVGDANGGPTTDGYYTQTIKLTGYSGVALKSVQFTIVTNGKVIGYQLKKTAAVATWNLSTKIMRGTVQADGSSNDSINVVLWAVAPTDQINPTASVDLLTFGYDVVNINTDYATTSMNLTKILGAQAGTFLDAYLNKDALGNTLPYTQTLVIKNRINRGDVNNDDRVDILDLLMIVDHITGKAPIPKPSDSFTAADVAPWPNGDGVVNVLDLAQLQSIILNNAYPDGLPLLGAKVAIAEMQKGATTSAFEATAYVTADNLTVIIHNNVPYRGCQLYIEGIQSAPSANGNDVTGFASGLQNGRLTILGKSASEVAIGSDIVVANIPVKCRVQEVLWSNGIQIINDKLQNGSITTNVIFGKAPAKLTGIPDAFALSQNYPNPFNPSTKINIAVPQTSQVRVVVYNMLGQEVATLVNEVMSAGFKSINWNGMDSNGKAIATGTYIYRMTAGNFVETKKMMFLK